MLHSLRPFLLVLLVAAALYFVIFVPESSVVLFVCTHSTCFLCVLGTRLWLRQKYGKGLLRLNGLAGLFDWPIRYIFIALIASWFYLIVDGERSVASVADQYLAHYESEIVQEFTYDDVVERTIYHTGNSWLDYLFTDYRGVATIALTINLGILWFVPREYYRRCHI